MNDELMEEMSSEQFEDGHLQQLDEICRLRADLDNALGAMTATVKSFEENETRLHETIKGHEAAMQEAVNTLDRIWSEYLDDVNQGRFERIEQLVNDGKELLHDRLQAQLSKHS